jgi:hypothetical protein
MEGNVARQMKEFEVRDISEVPNRSRTVSSLKSKAIKDLSRDKALFFLAKNNNPQRLASNLLAIARKLELDGRKYHSRTTSSGVWIWWTPK